MFPDSPAIIPGSAVEVELLYPNGPYGSHVSGRFLAITEAGVFLGRDMLHVERFIPTPMVGIVVVVKHHDAIAKE